MPYHASYPISRNGNTVNIGAEPSASGGHGLLASGGRCQERVEACAAHTWTPDTAPLHTAEWPSPAPHSTAGCGSAPCCRRLVCWPLTSIVCTGRRPRLGLSAGPLVPRDEYYRWSAEQVSMRVVPRRPTRLGCTRPGRASDPEDGPWEGGAAEVQRSAVHAGRCGMAHTSLGISMPTESVRDCAMVDLRVWCMRGGDRRRCWCR